MLGRFGTHVRNQWMGALALFVALGGTAYAVNTVSSADIINGEVRTPDLAAGAVKAPALGGNAVRSNKVLDDTHPAGGLNASDLNLDSVASSEVVDDSLTGA